MGVTCRNEKGVVEDCTADCCCHDDESGPVACGRHCKAFQDCSAGVNAKGLPRSPTIFDYADVACLRPGDARAEATEGRIRPITAGSQ